MFKEFKKKQNFEKKYPKIKKEILKTRGVEVVKPIVRRKFRNPHQLGCSRKGGDPVITANDLECKKK